MTGRELWTMDPRTAEEVWTDGWRLRQQHAEEYDIPRAWTRGFLSGVLAWLLGTLIAHIL
jgi:hypothetical protein